MTFGDQVANELNVSLMQVTNDGNEPIENLTFDVTIPGEHRILLADCMGTPSLKKAIEITFSDQVPQTDPIFNFRFPFFNPREMFRVKTLVDGPAAVAKLFCRMPGTTVEIIDDSDRYADLYGRPSFFFTILPWLRRALLFAIAAYLVLYQFPKYRFFLKQAPTAVLEKELKGRAD